MNNPGHRISSYKKNINDINTGVYIFTSKQAEVIALATKHIAILVPLSTTSAAGLPLPLLEVIKDPAIKVVGYNWAVRSPFFINALQYKPENVEDVYSKFAKRP